jgi:hypothetical protein
MPSAPHAAQPVTGTPQEAVAPDTGASAPTPGRAPNNAKARQLRPTAPDILCGNHLRRVVNGLRHVLKASYYDPKFQRPDMVEDDYYRFRNQPREY